MPLVLHPEPCESIGHAVDAAPWTLESEREGITVTPDTAMSAVV